MKITKSRFAAKVGGVARHAKRPTLAFLISLPLAACGGHASDESSNKNIVRVDNELAWLQRASEFSAFREPAIGAAHDAGNPYEQGFWSKPIEWPFVATSAANQPDGTLLTWTTDSSRSDGPVVTTTAVYNSVLNTLGPPHDSKNSVSAAAHTLLPDGRVLALGFDASGPRAARYSNGKWRYLARSADRHVYPGLVTLGTGQVYVGPADVETGTGELWTAGKGWETVGQAGDYPLPKALVSGDLQPEWLPDLMMVPNGSVFYSGPANRLFSLPIDKSGAASDFGPREPGEGNRQYGTSVFYDVGKIMIAGGGKPASKSAMTIDVNGRTPLVNSVSSMQFDRAMHNSVVLPNGEVMVIGGVSDGIHFNDATSQLIPELWNPASGEWRAVSAHTVPRNYQSNALLLQDGRVIAMGGGQCGACASNHPNAEIFSPPYLFTPDGHLAEQPLVNAPASAKAGDSIVVTGTLGIEQFNLVKLTTVSHHQSQGQRLIPIEIESQLEGSYSLSLPENTNVLLPGYYWLFGLDAAGVPSVGSTIRIMISQDQVSVPASEVEQEAEVLEVEQEAEVLEVEQEAEVLEVEQEAEVLEVQQEQESGFNAGSLEPVIQQNPPAVGTEFSYAQIAANALPEFLLEMHGEYLAELLRQNPKIRWWSQDKAMRTITITSEPKTTGKVVNIEPSGGDDTAMIRNASAAAGNGGVVQGNGEVFKVNQLQLTKAGVTFRDMPMQPSVLEGFYSVRVKAEDVTFIRSPLDQLGRMFSHGFIILDGAHRFTMVDGGIANSINTVPKPGALMRITEDVDDVYIVGNEFKNSFASGDGNSVRGIWWSGPDIGKTPIRGIIASNLFENLQSSEKGNDADALVVQGLDNNNRFEENLLFIANVGINSGKRLIKAQSGGIDAHGNFSWWRDAEGPEGVRVTRTHYDNHGPSNCRWTNNIARTDHSNPDSESFFMAMQTHRWEKELQSHDIVFRNNIYEHNDTTDGNRTSYGFFIFDFVGDQTISWPVDSSISNNVIRGSGELRFLYWFRNGVTKEIGPDPMGSQFEHSGNVIDIPIAKSIYRQN